jgi:hypothetical protein
LTVWDLSYVGEDGVEEEDVFEGYSIFADLCCEALLRCAIGPLSWVCGEDVLERSLHVNQAL